MFYVMYHFTYVTDSLHSAINDFIILSRIGYVLMPRKKELESKTFTYLNHIVMQSCSNVMLNNVALTTEHQLS